jgi:hypothetical protein
MSTAKELLRRALETLESMRLMDLFRVDAATLPDDIRAYLAAEPEAEYDFYGVIPLTHRKAKGIIKDNGYHVTGFVLSRPDGDKCIVDMSAVRWLTGKELFEMMHPPVVLPTAEPVEFLCNATRFKITGSKAEGMIYGIPQYLIGKWVAFVDADNGQHLKLTKLAEQSRKPMTEEEMDQGFKPYKARWLADDQYFVAGVRFAEKHHFGIGGDDE